MISFKINSNAASFEGDEDTPLLWVLRDELELTGAKYGCGIGLCGACTVHIDGRAQPSCRVPVGSIDGRSVTTIEGLAAKDGTLHPVQQAWLATDAPQCGYCQSGMIMAAVEFLERNPDPSDKDIDDSVTNLCRCGSYVRVREAIHMAARTMGDKK